MGAKDGWSANCTSIRVSN